MRVVLIRALSPRWQQTIPLPLKFSGTVISPLKFNNFEKLTKTSLKLTSCQENQIGLFTPWLQLLMQLYLL